MNEARALAIGEVDTVEVPPVVEGAFFAYRAGSAAPGCLDGDVIYTPLPGTPKDAVGKQCIVRLVDGERRLCWLMQGAGPDRYDLVIPGLPLIQDAEVVEAAPVAWIKRG
jgi:hypothetical protein